MINDNDLVRLKELLGLISDEIDLDYITGDDAEFIALARNLMPQLLQELEQLREFIDL